MQPEVKLSKFMFHLKFSSKEDYVHEHELYEVMRSRNLYQYQFSVRSNFQKRMRNIEISEKAQRYGFENSRKLFVQKMRERREQADKLKAKNDSLMKKLRTDLDGKKLKRRYVPIPASTIVYEELPTLLPKLNASTSSIGSLTHHSERTGSRGSSPVQAPPTPSAIAATILSDPTKDHKEKVQHEKAEKAEKEESNLLIPHAPAKKRGSDAGSARSTNNGKTPFVNGTMNDKSTVEKEEVKEENKQDNFIENDEEYERKRREFESRAIKGHGKQHTSAVHFSEDPTTDKTISRVDIPSTYGDTLSKIETWRERHGLVSKTDVEQDTAFGRLMIDRPSKWALSHVHNDLVKSTELGMRYEMLKTSLQRFNASFKKKSQQLDDLSMKLRIQSKQKVSLPELDTTPKPMVRLDPGGTTPDGRLILTKADYDDYLSDYQKARLVRLDRSKKKAKLLYKLIENFTLDPHHRLQDETDLSSGIHTI